MAHISLYDNWRYMMRDCYNAKSYNYSQYGAKGITVCKTWHTFKNFEKWATSNGYAPELILERVNKQANTNRLTVVG